MCIHTYIYIYILRCARTGLHAPGWGPGPRSHQNPSKIKSWSSLGCCSPLLGPSWRQKGLKSEKPDLGSPSWASILGGFWSYVGTKIDLKSVQEPFEIHSKNYLVFDTLTDRFLMDFGSNLKALNLQKLSSRLSAVHILHIWALCLLDGSWKPSWLHFGRFWDPSWGQVGPKMASCYPGSPSQTEHQKHHKKIHLKKGAHESP